MKSYPMKFCIIFLILFLSSCSSNNAVAPPHFELTSEQLKALRAKFKKTDYDIYFILMVDREGNVVRSKVIDRDESIVSARTAARFSAQLAGKLTFNKRPENEYEFMLIPHGMRISSKVKKY